MAWETAEATEVGEGGVAFVSHASFLPRLVAYVLDMTLLLIPLIAYLRATGPPVRLLGLAVPFVFNDAVAWWGWVLLAAASFLYFALLETHGGRTVGKRVVGICVTDAAMGPVGTRAALVRNLYRLLYHVPVAGLVILVLDGALILRSGRRVGDLAAETLVIKVPGEW